MGDSSRATDRIYIRDLRLRCIIGIYDDERSKVQDVTINIELEADLSEARLSDRIEDTVDYKGVKQRIVKLVESSEHFLVERLAERIADACLEEARVTGVRVLVEKPGALRFARTVGVEIYKRRAGDEAS